MVPDEKEVLSAHACLGSSVELKQSVASKRESNVHWMALLEIIVLLFMIIGIYDDIWLDIPIKWFTWIYIYIYVCGFGMYPHCIVSLYIYIYTYINIYLCIYNTSHYFRMTFLYKTVGYTPSCAGEVSHSWRFARVVFFAPIPGPCHCGILQHPPCFSQTQSPYSWLLLVVSPIYIHIIISLMRLLRLCCFFNQTYLFWCLNPHVWWF